LFTCFFSFGQFSIQGKVLNEEGAPLSEVHLLIENTFGKAISGTDGSFMISGMRNGTYTVKAGLSGYETERIECIVKDQDLILEFRMHTSAVTMEEVQVSAVRATEKTPTTYTNLDTKQIKKLNYGQDLPYLLEGTPSTVVTSDAGAGVGYTGIRIRGVDPTRTNVTVNGVPLNDCESHGVYWVNMPDFASSIDNIQVQRGVGTSTNGAAAFGSSINIKTDNITKKAYAESDNSYGSFNTLKTTVKAGTGLIHDKFALDVRLSKIGSDGYIDRASSNLKAFYLSGAYVGKTAVLKANIFSGVEKTYQAWWGIPEAKLDGNTDSLTTHFYNNYYPSGMYENAQDSSNLFGSDPRTYNYYTYKNETDNYQQDHYQLHYTQTLHPKLTLNLTGHLTRGRGYYEQYRKNEDLSFYGLNSIYLGSDTVSTTDVIRRRWLDNIFYGSILTLSYQGDKGLKIIGGSAWNYYDGGHFGEIIWARYASQSELGQRYYDNNAQKLEVNAFIKSNYQWKKFNFYFDLQLRQINYQYESAVEQYSSVTPKKNSVDFTFFNPKAGLMYDINSKNNLYASIAVSNREPVRDDFVQSSANSVPKPEQLTNVEAGHRYRSGKLFVNTNYYLMNYTNQLILTGEINDVGNYVRTNVAKSYRSGLEIESGYMLTKKWSVTANLTLSQNKIKEFNEFIDNYDNYDANGNMIQTVVNHTNTDIAFSPNIIASLGLGYQPIKGLDINLLNKYVGKQYLDNTSSENRKLNAYAISNVQVSYTLIMKNATELKFGLAVNNLLNHYYENNGYTWGYIAGGLRITENFYYPQAGRNYLLRLAIKF
jgi:iron complex outermembrane receptor protein